VLKYEKEEPSLKTLEKNLIEFKNQYNIAKKIQSSIFPPSLPNNHLISITAKLISLFETSGDFYDVTELISNSVYGVFIADIQGHGVSAALVTNIAKILFVNAAEKYISPSKVLDYINREICNILRQRSFFTTFYLVVDFPNKQVMYSAGGHSYSLRYNIEKKDIEILDTKDTIIGLIEEISFEEKSFKFNIGDRIILYTDGIPEAKNKNGAMFGNERLYDLIKSNSELPAQELIDLIDIEVKRFTKFNHYDDDVTIIIIDIKSDKANAGEEGSGKSYYSRDDISRLIEYYKKSIAIKEEQKDDDGLIKDLINLGSHLSKKGDSKEALEYIKRAEFVSNN
jgi:serine phosphatase RsbU (regulator of sigma subunit)